MLIRQVMPQLLHYLGVDKRAKGEETEAGMMPEGLTIEQQQLYRMATQKSLDWGSIDVYTCTASCEKIASKVKEVGGGRYLEEFVFVQPPLLLMSTTAAPTPPKSSSSTSDHS